MLTSEQIKTLKQVNVSKDADLTKVRLKEDFSSASNADKKKIEELSGQKRGSFYRAYSTGAVNARLVLAMAQILKTAPQYYTGESEKKPLENADIVEFLKARGYKGLVSALSGDEPKPKRKYNRKPASSPLTEEETVLDAAQEELPPEADTVETDNMNAENEVVTFDEPDTVKIILNLPNPEGLQDTIASLSEEDTILLLKALLLRAKAGGEVADYEMCIKWLLLL